jgi:hypothetical protein
MHNALRRRSGDQFEMVLHHRTNARLIAAESDRRTGADAEPAQGSAARNVEPAGNRLLSTQTEYWKNQT